MQIFYLPLHIRRKNLLFIKLLLGWESYYERGYVIADWNIRLEEDMYHIEMNVYDEDYIEDQYLPLGVFHAVLYG